jgi:hypothetical protein
MAFGARSAAGFLEPGIALVRLGDGTVPPQAVPVRGHCRGMGHRSSLSNPDAARLPAARVCDPREVYDATCQGVERAFAWTSRFRRVERDDERLPETVAGWHFGAIACLMGRRVVTVVAQRPEQARERDPSGARVPVTARPALVGRYPCRELRALIRKVSCVSPYCSKPIRR